MIKKMLSARRTPLSARSTQLRASWMPRPALRMLLPACWMLLPAILHAQATNDSALLKEVETVSGLSGYAKYASSLSEGNGKILCSFTSMEKGQDRIVVRSRTAAGWGPAVRIDEGQGCESYSSLLAADGATIWAFWQGRRNGHWAVYCRLRRRGQWGKELRLTDDSLTALHPKVIRDAKGVIWLVYERMAGHSITLQAMTYAAGKWGTPFPVNTTGLHRRASLALAHGGIWLAWDSPDSGNYDIWLSRLHAEAGNIRMDTLMQATRDGGIDDSPSLATAPDGTLWLGWNSLRSLRDEADRPNRHAGAIFLKAYKDHRWWTPGAVSPGLPEGQMSEKGIDKSTRDAEEDYWHWKQTQNYPYVYADDAGRIWTLWRSDPTGGHNFDIFGRVYNDTGWSKQLRLTAFSPGRDEWPQLLTAGAAGPAIFWEGQELPPKGEEARYQGGFVDAYNTRANKNVILWAKIDAGIIGYDRMGALHPMAPEVYDPADDQERVNDRERVTERNEPGGATDKRQGMSYKGKKLFFGDPHSHSILSDAKYGWPDQLLFLSKYRRGIDFTEISDHSEMGRLQNSEYQELALLARVFSEEGRYIDFLGFEWTGTPEFGHRIVIWPGLEAPNVSSAEPDGNTIEKLYALLRQYHGVASAHHPGQATWGRWNPAAAYSPMEEPNFEVASWHGRAEFYDNPRQGRRQIPGHQYQDALSLGRRLGVLGGSDTHHLSPGEGGLTGVWADTLTRENIFDAIRSRHTYATTGARIRLLFTVNGQMMGSETRAGSADSTCSLHLEVTGTAAIDHIEIVKDVRNYYALVRLEQQPGTSAGVFMLYDPSDPQGGKRIVSKDLRTITLDLSDKRTGAREGRNEAGAARKDGAARGTSYYVRVTQTDGQQAWSSPVWIE